MEELKLDHFIFIDAKKIKAPPYGEKIIFVAFLYTTTIESTRALQQLFHWGSGSNGLIAQANEFRTQTLFSSLFFFIGTLKCNEMQMAIVRSKIGEFWRFLQLISLSWCLLSIPLLGVRASLMELEQCKYC